MLPSTRSIIADLVISLHETDGHPAVINRDKAELRRYLTHVVVNDVTLKHHLDLLTAYKVKLPNTMDFSDVQTIVNIGLDKLTNQELALLALDRLALTSLYEKIGDDDATTPEAWTPAVKAEGLKTVPAEVDNSDDEDDEND